MMALLIECCWVSLMTKIYGAKASQKGYDVKTCADQELLYSSEWPTLKIAYSGYYYIPSGSTENIVVKEFDLGYTPAFLTFFKMSFPSGVTRSSGGQLRINDSSLATHKTPTSYEEGFYYIFYHDLTSSFEAPIYNTTPTIPKESEDDTNHGIKVALPGKSVESTDYRDFAIHSDCFMMNIHKAGFVPYNNETPPFVETIEHNLGYAPFCLILADGIQYGLSGYYRTQSTLTDFQGFGINDEYLTIDTLWGNTAYIIFKDKIFN